MATYNPYFNLYQTLNQLQSFLPPLLPNPSWDNTGDMGELASVEVKPENANNQLSTSTPLTGYNIPSVAQRLGAQPIQLAQTTQTPPPPSGIQVKGLPAVMGGLQLASDIGSIAGQGLNLGQPGLQYFAEGVRPTYQGGEYMGRVAAATPQGASAGEIGSTAFKAGMAGFQATGNPLIGLGAAAVGGIGAAIGGGVRKRKQRREKAQALDLAKAQQQEYNMAASDFAAREAASVNRNPYRRMQNLFA